MESQELAELAADAGAADLPSSGGGEGQITARLSPESRAAEGQEIELWLDVPAVHLFDPQSGARLSA